MLSTLREEILPNLETTIGQRALDQNADKFLFVVVSRQTKKPFFLCVLCVSAVKSPNPYLRKSAWVCG